MLSAAQQMQARKEPCGITLWPSASRVVKTRAQDFGGRLGSVSLNAASISSSRPLQTHTQDGGEARGGKGRRGGGKGAIFFSGPMGGGEGKARRGSGG